jgi:hypothetical protein
VAERELCYVALKPCGCAAGAIVPRGMLLSTLARRVAGWMQKGYAIEQQTVGDARELLQPCPHEGPHAQLNLMGRRP